MLLQFVPDIDEVFAFEGQQYKCLSSKSCDGEVCTSCAFLDADECLMFVCEADTRSDGESVYFVKHEKDEGNK